MWWERNSLHQSEPHGSKLPEKPHIQYRTQNYRAYVRLGLAHYIAIIFSGELELGLQFAPSFTIMLISASVPMGLLIGR